MDEITKLLRENFITSQRDYKEGDVFSFRQDLSIPEDAREAEIYITALGVYEASLNGQKLGKQVFAPGYTYYPRDLFYQHYDLLPYLSDKNFDHNTNHNSDKNQLTVLVGQGWYCGRFTFNNKCQIYGEKQAASWVIRWVDGEGKEHLVTSKDSVREETSPYRYAGFYDGEIYDESLAHKAQPDPLPFTGKVPEHLEETYTWVELSEELSVQDVRKMTTGEGEEVTILDFGQNFAGMISIDPDFLPDGAELTIRHGEILNPDGSLYTANLRKAKATNVYKKGTGIYQPRFTYMGFRYVELRGAKYRPGLIKAHAIHNRMNRSGHFTSANDDVRKLYENTLWGQRSNFVEVPTDCPQRDERMGYTGDGQVFARTASYNYDTRAFYRKFLKDMRYSQMDNSEGYIPSTVPAEGPAGIGFLSMLGWGNAVTILPDLMQRMYGDRSFFEDQYESMKTFADMEIRHLKKGLWTGANLGDWLMPGKSMAWQAMHNGPVSNTFVINDFRILSKAAKELGKDEDAAYYARQFEESREAYIRKYIQKNGRMKGDYQGEYILALKYVVSDEDLRKKLTDRLIELVEKQGLDTGFFSTEFLLPTLADAGRSDLAYDLLLSEKCPGWMYEIRNGATTIWERWDAIREDGSVNETKSGGDNMVSFNHYAFGSVVEFYYEYILGIRPAEDGFQKVLIRPYPDRRLISVDGSYESVSGTIRSAWKYEGNEIHFEITVPVKAVILLPDGQRHEVEAGSYKYLVKEEK